MSSLLEQAIIDATALKEAALKNAETSVLEKYSVEIKEALKTLLEQEEAAPIADPTAAAPMSEPEVKGVNMAHTDNQKLCACPDEEDQQKIKLDVNQLADEVSNMDSVPQEDDSNLMSREELYGNVASPNTPPTANQVRQSPMMERVFKLDDSLLSESEQEEEYELDESLLDEATQVSLGQDESGNVGYKGSSYGFDPTNHTKHDLQVSKLQQKLKDEKDKTVALMKSEKELKKEVKEVASAALKLSDKVKQYQSVVSTLKEKLDAFALSNAKLLYTNRVLSNASLNERQKNKIVETLSNAKTPDEAKTIFETLQSAVGSTITNNAPKSLNEAVTRSVLSSISGRREQEPTHVPEVQRMQILAGIKK
jgi:hypothetical protein